MTFQLEVELGGLCYYLIHPDGRQIGVVMPDARLHDDKGLFHPDGDEAKPHVGYIRFDAADAGLALPGGTRTNEPNLPIDHPQYEVVHLFDFEELDFGLGFDEPLEPVELNVAKQSEYAPNATPLPGMFSKTPPREVLMRTVLRGGKLKSFGQRGPWKFSALLSNNVEYKDKLQGSAHWTRRVHADELVLRINDWSGNEKTVIRLTPRSPDRVIKIKIGNLCTENTLEWAELPLREVSPGGSDDDFKWFYRLMRDQNDKSWESFTLDKNEKLPHPILDQTIDTIGGDTNCGSNQSNFDFTK